MVLPGYRIFDSYLLIWLTVHSRGVFPIGDRYRSLPSGSGGCRGVIRNRKLASEKWKRGIMKECNFARIFGMIV